MFHFPHTNLCLQKRAPKKKTGYGGSLKSTAKSAPVTSSTVSPPSMQANEAPIEMSPALNNEQSPLELTTSATQGISSRSSPGVISNEPLSLDSAGNVATSGNDEQQLYAAQQQQSALQPQKLFDLNQLTEQEKIVLSASGSARLYQASSQDEIDAIMQQVLDSKTTDTILIVSPVGRQIVTCNENGDQIITRVMTDALRPEDGMSFHSESPENHQIPDPVLDYSGQHHAMDRQTMYLNGSDLEGSPPQRVIFEKHLTPEQIEMLNDETLRKTGRGIQDMYTEQAVGSHEHQQLVYDNNNNNNSHIEMEGGQIMKSVSADISDGSVGDGEAMRTVNNNKSQIGLIYNDGSKSTGFATPTTQVTQDEQQHKTMGLYANSADLENYIEGGSEMMGHPSEGLPFEGSVQGEPTVYVVQGMVNGDDEEAMDLQSGLR